MGLPSRNSISTTTTTTTTLSLKRLLLLSRNPLAPTLDQQALALPHAIHVPLSDILAIGELAQILEVVFGEGLPEGVFVDEDLEAGEDELGLGGARRALAHLVREPEGLGHGDGGLDREEGRAFLHLLREHASAPSG